MKTLSRSDTSLFPDLHTFTSLDKSPLLQTNPLPIICHLNACSLLNKINEIRTHLQTAKMPVILGISETWLTT